MYPLSRKRIVDRFQDEFGSGNQDDLYRIGLMPSHIQQQSQQTTSSPSDQQPIHLGTFHIDIPSGVYEFCDDWKSNIENT